MNYFMFKKQATTYLLICMSFWLYSCTTAKAPQRISSANASSFTLVVIPDTQNAVDHTRQKSQGFAINGADVFIKQMQYIASKGVSNGGDVAFVTSVGDVWQHQSAGMDPAHKTRGVLAMKNPILDRSLSIFIKPKELYDFEIPKAVAGYQILANANIPFAVAPGNHDYDAIWSMNGFPPNLTKDPKTLTKTVKDLGLAHVGGLTNFTSAFGSNSDFFKDKPWYIASYKDGANSAQKFTAAGYTFLNLAFEMNAGDDVLAWAQQVIDANKGLPTIITTHDYLNPKGERKSDEISDLAVGDPKGHNNAEDIWQDFISQNDQIFMVLSGHQIGQSRRVDLNKFGHKVYQIMADFQERGQVGVDAGQAMQANGFPYGISDGWLREMTFNLTIENPHIEVKSYSSHYHSYAQELDSYSTWYKKREQPQMTESEFVASDSFTLPLDDFIQRFKVN